MDVRLIYKNIDKIIDDSLCNNEFITYENMFKLGKGLDSRDIKMFYDRYLQRFERWKTEKLNEYVVISAEYDNFKDFNRFFHVFKFPIRDEEKDEYYDKYIELFSKLRNNIGTQNRGKLSFEHIRIIRSVIIERYDV